MSCSVLTNLHQKASAVMLSMTWPLMQVNQLLELESEQSMNTQKYSALDNWAKNLGATHQAILNKMTS